MMNVIAYPCKQKGSEKDKTLPTLHYEYRPFWCPGDARNQASSGLGIDFVCMKYLGDQMGRVMEWRTLLQWHPPLMFSANKADFVCMALFMFSVKI